MPDTGFNMAYLSKSVFLVENILFLYIFLTPGKKRLFQCAAFAATWVIANLLRKILLDYGIGTLPVSHIVGTFYLIPCVLIFKETIQAKIFVFFMIYSLTQSIYLVFMRIDLFLSPPVPQTYVLVGMLLELASLPLINRYVRSPVRNIIKIINFQNPVFTLFPILSFLLLAVYGLQWTYRYTTFITLVLTTSLIFFSYYLVAVSISGARRLQELELISMTDSLTGLYNRRYMEKKIRQEYQHYLRTGIGFALASADIDFFKNVNDRYGHDCGDSLLKAVSGVFLGSVRTYDTVARWGGEEFLFLFPAASEQQAMELAERIRKRVEAGSYIPADESAVVTITIGVSVIIPGDTVDGLIKRADIAMYHGKGKSRNCVVSYYDIGLSV